MQPLIKDVFVGKITLRNVSKKQIILFTIIVDLKRSTKSRDMKNKIPKTKTKQTKKSHGSMNTLDED